MKKKVRLTAIALSIVLVFASMLCGCKKKDKRQHAYMWIVLYECKGENNAWRRYVQEWLVTEETYWIDYAIKKNPGSVYQFQMVPMIKQEYGFTIYEVVENSGCSSFRSGFYSHGEITYEEGVSQWENPEKYHIIFTPGNEQYIYPYSVEMLFILYL